MYMWTNIYKAFDVGLLMYFAYGVVYIYIQLVAPSPSDCEPR